MYSAKFCQQVNSYFGLRLVRRSWRSSLRSVAFRASEEVGRHKCMVWIRWVYAMMGPMIVSFRCIRGFMVSSGLLLSKFRSKRSLHNTIATNADLPTNKDFKDFIFSRHWTLANDFWQGTIVKPRSEWPSFVIGDSHPGYGINNMNLLFEAGNRGEFVSNSSRYQKRKTYAIQVGYVGHHFHGYQQQKHVFTNKQRPLNITSVISQSSSSPTELSLNALQIGDKIELPTVEGAIRRAVDNLTCYCAGRTDRGVHAVSQIVNFATSDPSLTAECILKMLRTLPEHQESSKGNSKEKSLYVFDCVRVPKSFNARSSARWRRYIFLIPCKSHLNLSKNDSLSQDIEGNFHFLENEARKATFSHWSKLLCQDPSLQFLQKLLQHLCLKELPYAKFSKLNAPLTKNNIVEDGKGFDKNGTKMPSKEDLCTLLQANVYLVHLPTGTKVSSLTTDIHVSNNVDEYAIGVEVVGNRFLRHMMRILVGTALQETLRFVTHTSSIQNQLQEQKEEYKLLHFLQQPTSTSTSSDDNKPLVTVSTPLPPHGLCFAGVGYNYTQLAIYKDMPKKEKDALLAMIS